MKAPFSRGVLHMEGVRFIGFALAALLSYQMPVYTARYFGLESELNALWATGLSDNLAGMAIFVVVYMLAGFVIWAAPLALIFALSKSDVRSDIADVLEPAFKVLAAPLRPLHVGITRQWDKWTGELGERRAVKVIYKREFAAEFPSFSQFLRYYRWVNAQDYSDPRKPLTASGDGYKDALSFLGLNDAFDRAALNSRFGLLMKQVHPDIAGPNDIARRLTEAREIIRARKGWK
jgi:hypothetical protein